jgi:hypothetical protein
MSGPSGASDGGERIGWTHAELSLATQAQSLRRHIECPPEFCYSGASLRSSIQQRLETDRHFPLLDGRLRGLHH